MISAICKTTIRELIDQGWLAIYSEQGAAIVGIRSTADNWCDLTWAQRVFYRAKFGFDTKGVLDIPVSELFDPSRGRDFYYREPDDEILIPDRPMPGSNQRLRGLLELGKVEIEAVGYDNEARLHIGHDGSAILVTEASWGLPIPNDIDYIEPDDKYMCYWDETNRHNWLPTAPWWAMPPID